MSGEIIKKKSYDLAFKLKAIENAEVEGIMYRRYWQLLFDCLLKTITVLNTFSVFVIGDCCVLKTYQSQ